MGKSIRSHMLNPGNTVNWIWCKYSNWSLECYRMNISVISVHSGNTERGKLHITSGDVHYVFCMKQNSHKHAPLSLSIRYYGILMIEVGGSSETSVHFYQNIWRYTLHSHGFEDFKCYYQIHRICYWTVHWICTKGDEVSIATISQIIQ